MRRIDGNLLQYEKSTAGILPPASGDRRDADGRRVRRRRAVEDLHKRRVRCVALVAGKTMHGGVGSMTQQAFDGDGRVFGEVVFRKLPRPQTVIRNVVER